MGAPTPPDKSRGSHVVPGLRLWRLACDMVVSAVEVDEILLCDGDVEATVEYGQRSRWWSNANCSSNAASPPPALKSYVMLPESGERRPRGKRREEGIGAEAIVLYQEGGNDEMLHRL